MLIARLFVHVLLSACCVLAARNAASEEICQKFLTSKKTNPLNPKNRRNFTRDENAEFECELVLQDQTLPVQIRSTIHEGMSWLAVRHCQAGLRRHRDVVRNLEILTQISPQHHNFAYRAGYWSLETAVSNVEAALNFLEAAVHGVASKSPIRYLVPEHPKQVKVSEEEAKRVHFTPEEDAYFARRHLIIAYCNQGRYFAALREVLDSLSQYPVDFGVLALYKQLKALILQNDPDVTATLLEEESTLEALKEGGEGDALTASAQAAYDLVLRHASSYYLGGGSSSKLVRHDPSLHISYEEFNHYVRSRTPVAIPAATSIVEDAGLSTLIESLSDCGSLFSHADEQTELTIEISDKPSMSSSKNAANANVADSYSHLGYGLATRKGYVNYLDYLEKVYCADYDGEHKPKPKSDGTPRANVMAGQHPINPRKHNYYVTTQIREDAAAYYKLKNDRYIGAYFDQQPMFMQYVIEDSKARKRYKDGLIYVEHLSVEEVAERMTHYDAEVTRRNAAKNTTNARLYNSPLHTFLNEMEAAVPSILYKPTADVGKSELSIEGEVTTADESTDSELYDIWGNMTDINLWMGSHGNSHTSTKARLHMDPHDNLYTLVEGKKSFLLIPPEFATKLETIFPTYSIGSNGLSFRSGANIVIPWENKQANWESSPDFVNIVPPSQFASDNINSHFSSLLLEHVEDHCRDHGIPYEIVELNTPGDRLFIPAGWFHQVSSYGAKHMAVNYWWRPFGWRENAKTFEANELGSLREKLLSVLKPDVTA